MGEKAALNACGKCVKILFILINLLYLLLGIALIAVGSYLVASGNSYSVLTSNNFFSAAAILIIAGIVVFIFTAIGIAGAFFQWKFVLYFYVVILVIIIILEIVATILGFVYRDTIADSVTENALDAIEMYFPTDNDKYDKGNNNAVDSVQETFECCGWNSTESWYDSPYYQELGVFPPSCECKNDTAEDRCMMIGMQDIYSNTCDVDFSNRLKSHAGIVGGVGVAFAIAQVIPVLLAIALIYSMHKNAEYVTV